MLFTVLGILKPVLLILGVVAVAGGVVGELGWAAASRCSPSTRFLESSRRGVGIEKLLARIFYGSSKVLS